MPGTLRILILNYEYPPLGGGAGVITRRHAEEFSDIGHKVTVLTTRFGDDPEEETNGNLRIVRLKARRKSTDRSNPLEMFSWMMAAKRYLRKNVHSKDYDLCIAHFSLPGGPPAYWLKKKFGIPYVIISHGHDIPWYFPRQMFPWHFLLFFIIRFYCLQSARNILLTTDMKRIADSFVGKRHAAKNKIIHNGLNTSKNDWSMKTDHLKVVFVGRMVAQKDPVQFIEAVNLLNQEGIPAEYHMFGDGPLMDKVTARIDECGITNLTLHGKVDNAEVIEAMKSSHLMIAPSLHEAMSVSVLEAISNGVYVITTPVSGNKQLIIDGMNGKLVPHGDLQAIVDEVRRFFAEDLDRRDSRLGEDYYRKFNHLYGWESVVKLYQSLFDEIMEEQRTQNS